MKSALLITLLLITATAFAQQSAVDLLRQDLKKGKVALMTASLTLSEKEGEVFWPIYREYGEELNKLGDRRIAVLRRYSQTYNNVTELAAGEMMKESFSIARDRNDLLEKYYDRVAKELGVLTAARFAQVENQMLTAIDAKLIDEVPLVKVPKPADGEQK